MTTIGIIRPTDFQKILMVILSVVIAYGIASQRCIMHLSTDFGGFCQFLDSQQASALSNASKVVRVVRFIIWNTKGTQNAKACKTYPMGVEIFPLIFLICWTYEQAI